jgi:hypothetical protein
MPDRNQQPHQDKQRHHAEYVAGNAVRGCQGQQLAGNGPIVFNQPDTQQRQKHQGNGHVHAGVYQKQDSDDG